jgi:hypothetical protein
MPLLNLNNTTDLFPRVSYQLSSFRRETGMLLPRSENVGHSSMLASVELKKRENRDDLDIFQMNSYVPCGIISI